MKDIEQMTVHLFFIRTIFKRTIRFAGKQEQKKNNQG